MTEGAPVRLVAPVPVPVPLDEDGAVTMAQGRSRPAWAEIDLAAVAHNAAVLARLVAPAELCAVVKAHGYGHGGPAVARAALAGGAGRLAVALVDEGVELREHGVTAPVLLLSECDPAAAATALSYGLTATLYSAEGIAAFSAAAAAGGRPVAVHVKVDTGMHRVGVAPEDLHAVASAVVADPLLQLESIWTHLPVADGVDAVDRAYTEGQLDLFDRLVAELAAVGIRAPLLHAANTAGAIAFPRSRYDMVRCGLGLYGYLPGPAVREAFAEQAGGERLRPAMALKARVVAVRRLDAGERPGARSSPPSRSATPTACPGPSSTAASRPSSVASAVPWPAR
jgi:alanine racemase